MIRIVVDTSIVVSAAFKDRIPEEIILFIAGSDDFEWIASPEIINEYNDVLARERFGLPSDILRHWRDIFDECTSIVEPEIKLDFPRDQKDAIFLECALVSEADYLLTGDKDFSDAKKMLATTIISVAQFKNLILDTI